MKMLYIVLAACFLLGTMSAICMAHDAGAVTLADYLAFLWSLFKMPVIALSFISLFLLIVLDGNGNPRRCWMRKDE